VGVIVVVVVVVVVGEGWQWVDGRCYVFYSWE
jgi:hypothetical protein